MTTPSSPATPSPPPPIADEAGLLRLLDGFMVARAFMAAHRLGVFRALWHAPRSTEALVTDLGLPVRAGRILAEACVASGLLTLAADGALMVPPTLAPMLVREASTDFQMVQYLLDFYRDVYADFTELETLIQSDGASSKFTRRDYFKDHVEDVPADVAAEYSAYMASTMRAIAAVALDDLDVRAVRRAVDLCGGPGTFAIELAARHGARVAFVDVPPVVAFSRQVLATAGAVAELVEPVAGDAFAYEIGSDVDLVTMCRAAHDWSDEQCQRLFDRLGQQLRPGARFAIIERLLPDELAAEAQNLYVRSLYFLSKSTTAQYRTPRRYRAMLAQAGFTEVTIQRPSRTPYPFFKGLALIVARKA